MNKTNIRQLTGDSKYKVKSSKQMDALMKFALFFVGPSGKSTIREDNKGNVVFNEKKYKIKEN